jgi:DNA end-binding protein Ku
MAARSIGSGTISFGLVTIPFKVYTAVSEQRVSFNMLHKGCGSRLSQQLICPVDNVVVSRADTVSGYEHTRDQYVVFEKGEIEALKTLRAGTLSLEQFVPAETVDLLYIEKSYYIGPDKGGAVGYRVLAEALERTEKIGVGRYAKQGKDVLVLIRPYKGGLIMHEAYYANEIRPWKDVEIPEAAPITDQHIQMATLLIEQLERPAFDAGEFDDEWAVKVKEAVAAKLAGEEVKPAPQPKTVVIDLLEALKQSVAANDAELEKRRRENPVAAKGPKKAVPRAQEGTKKAAKKKRRGGE